jgi:DNA-binding response OmpR family regulator
MFPAQMPMDAGVTKPIRDKPLILVADDEEDILALVSYRLEEEGYEVAQASDGDAALRLAKELIPDLAVIDVMMPHKNGYEVTESIRAHEATARVPVILLTARIQDSDVKRGFEVGADEYIKKPFSPLDLRARVSAVLDAQPRGGLSPQT